MSKQTASVLETFLERAEYSGYSLKYDFDYVYEEGRTKKGVDVPEMLLTVYVHHKHKTINKTFNLIGYDLNAVMELAIAKINKLIPELGSDYASPNPDAGSLDQSDPDNVAYADEPIYQNAPRQR